MSKIPQLLAPSTQYNVWWYTSNWRLLLFYKAISGPLYQNEVKWSAFDMQMILHSHANKTHFHKKGCASRASYWKWGSLELGNGLLSIKPRFFFQHSIVNVKWTVADFFEETRDLLTSFELAGLNALHVRSTLHQKYNFLSLELARAVFRE